MNVRTYRAETMREALDLVRRELGSDAIIFSTRQSPVRRRFPWQRAREAAEIVAGVAEQTAPLRNSIGRGVGLEVLPASASFASTDDESSLETKASDIPESPPNEALADLIRQLGSRVRSSVHREIPDELFHLYTRLIDADVHEQDARDVVLELPIELRSAPQAWTPALESMIERHVAGCHPIRVTPGVRTVAALVGPTGVGKTTTLAKLAANFKLRNGIKVGLITVDTYRVAAVDQLRTYADLINLPMHVVSSPREMRGAMQQLNAMDLVLIDTAGRSPRDEVKIQELKGYLAEADVDQVHLVLSLVAGARSLEQAAEKFRPVGVTSLLLTKLDEAAGAGAILSAARRIDLPISYLTNGQDVPDDIEPASTPHLTRLILSAIESPSTAEASHV